MKIKSRFDHFNFNVVDLDKSIEFYEKALGLRVKREHVAEDGSFILKYLTDESSSFLLELTWIRDFKGKYNLGDEEFHLCMRVDGDYEKVKEFHKENGWIAFDNKEMGLYFITDPDGYWIEILPSNF